MQARILGSFHYLSNVDLVATVRRASALGVDVDFFADSGAFSAANAGATINLPQYAAWLRANADVINFAASLDVIADPAASRANAEALTDLVGDAVVVVPTFHANTSWAELERLCAGNRLVALGGAVPVANRQQAMLAWLAKAHKIARDHGTVLHGFGLTRPPYPSALPWYSVDSSYWTAATRTGTLALFDAAQQRFATVRVGTPAVARRGALLRSYGAEPAHVAQPGFGRVNQRGPQARDESRWMIEAAVESWLRYADWLAAGRVVPAPPQVRGDGTKVYLAAGSVPVINLLVDATRAHHAPGATNTLEAVS